MWNLIFDSLIDALKDGAILLPFLFVVFVLIEGIEHKTSGLMARIAAASEREGSLWGKLGPVWGSGLGLIPQCGFSVMGANMYAGGIITLGTLMAIFLATSDEAILIMVSDPSSVGKVVPLLLCKLIIGIVFGYAIDLGRRMFYKTRRAKVHVAHHHEEHRYEEHHHNHEEHTHCHDYTDEHGHKHADYTYCQKCDEEVPEHKHHPHDHCLKCDEEVPEHKHHPHDLCANCGCDKYPGIVRPALYHTVKLFMFIFIFTFVINIIIGAIGTERLSSLLLMGTVFQPFLTALIGLIPNCAASVLITELYIAGGITFGSAVAGLCAGAGVGLAVLFKMHTCTAKNVRIVVLLYAISVFSGLIINAFV